MVHLLFLADLYLKSKYLLSELRMIEPGKGLERQMMANIRYTFKIVKDRMGLGTYMFDYDALKRAKDPGGVVDKLPVTTSRSYVGNMDLYNKWIARGRVKPTDIVLTSGTTGKPKIVSYTRYDSFRDLLLVARGLRKYYPDIDLKNMIFLLELATAYPAASSALVNHISSGLNILSIPTFLKETLDDIVIYLKKYYGDRDITILGYPSQLINVTPKKFREIDPSSIGIKALAPNGEVITRGAREIMRKIYNPQYIIGVYGSTETRIIGLERDDVYIVYGDRNFVGVVRSDGSIGVDGEGELVITPLYRKGEYPGTLIPMYRLGDLGRVRYEDGVYFIDKLRRVKDELFVGASNFNPVVMASMIEGELIDRRIEDPRIFFIFRRDKYTGIVSGIELIIITKTRGLDREIKGIVFGILDKYSEVIALMKAGTITIKSRIVGDIEEIIREYPSFVQRSYYKGGKYSILEAPG